MMKIATLPFEFSDLHYEDLASDEQPSSFEIYEEQYSVLNVQLPFVRKERIIELQSYGYIVTKDCSYVYNASNGELEKISDRFENIYLDLDRHIDGIILNCKNYQKEVTRLEDILYEGKTSKIFMKEWLKLKRDIIKVERLLDDAVIAFEEFIKQYKDEEDFSLSHYTDLLEHTNRSKNNSSLQLSKLDYLYNFHDTRTNEKMNRLIAVLTILSSVFLPLNFLVGFFGMNTSHLPFSEVYDGTSSVIILLIITAIISAVGMYWYKLYIQKQDKFSD